MEESLQHIYHGKTITSVPAPPVKGHGVPSGDGWLHAVEGISGTFTTLADAIKAARGSKQTPAASEYVADGWDTVEGSDQE